MDAREQAPGCHACALTRSPTRAHAAWPRTIACVPAASTPTAPDVGPGPHHDGQPASIRRPAITQPPQRTHPARRPRQDIGDSTRRCPFSSAEHHAPLVHGFWVGAGAADAMPGTAVPPTEARRETAAVPSRRSCSPPCLGGCLRVNPTSARHVSGSCVPRRQPNRTSYVVRTDDLQAGSGDIDGKPRNPVPEPL
jgi:hypothetical protein